MLRSDRVPVAEPVPGIGCTVRSPHGGRPAHRGRARSSIRVTPPSSSAPTTSRCWPGWRDSDPVHACGPGFWTLTRYEDIRDVSRDPSAFCSGRGALVNDPLRSAAPGEAHSSRSILHMDPPEHASFRSLVNRRFTPSALAGLGESIRKTASTLLEGVDATGEIDFVAELAAPFPLIVIAELLGIAEADRADFRRWSDAAIESPDLPPDETMASLGELSAFIVEHIRSYQRQPRRRPRLPPRRQRGGRRPAQQRGAVHVPPHLVGGGERDDAHPPLGHRTRAVRAPRPAGPGRRPTPRWCRARWRSACAGSPRSTPSVARRRPT